MEHQSLWCPSRGKSQGRYSRGSGAVLASRASPFGLFWWKSFSNIHFSGYLRVSCCRFENIGLNSTDPFLRYKVVKKKELFYSFCVSNITPQKAWPCFFSVSPILLKPRNFILQFVRFFTCSVALKSFPFSFIHPESVNVISNLSSCSNLLFA